jgi:hypothetical protein
MAALSIARAQLRMTLAPQATIAMRMQSAQAAVEALDETENSKKYMGKEDRFGAHNYHPLPGM